MTSRDDYFTDLARIRRLLERSLCGDVVLPDELLPENQTITADIRAQASAARAAFVSGDREAFLEASCGRSMAGFDRDSDCADVEVPELDEARDRVKKRLSERENGPENDDSGSGDCESDSP